MFSAELKFEYDCLNRYFEKYRKKKNPNIMVR